jgi:hypothetical protein
MSVHPFRKVSAIRPGPVTWQDKLDGAQEEAGVVEIARDYIATLDPHEVAMLPAPCRPRKLLTANDVSSYAFDLVRHVCDDKDEAAPFIHRLAAFFSHASIRLSELLRRTNDEDVDSEQAG